MPLAARLFSRTHAYRTARRFPRYRVSTPVRILRHVSTAFPNFQGRATDLNEGGLSLLAFLELRIGEQLSLEFGVPRVEQRLTIRGLIRNRNGCAYGVEFITETGADQENVDRLRSSLAVLARWNNTAQA